ncbi:MAG TPA: bifunctional phosphoribosylaminoimidazolecarboxamide formyltransferase/IMP cyclohydrolase, partial [Parvularculaceae bacterium]|nr:bifunctional phosphoribosylaminoimidazolecarboxamide formyltransferase/IMP cyclohydrolase [Parvularculaceae bacterium]
MSQPSPVRRALLSVSDKAGVEAFAKRLAGAGVELVSTGGTAKLLRGAGLNVRDVSELTGFPEMMDGRVKTLHPKVHGGLLALRDNKEHVGAMKAHDIPEIDLLVVNLYPFEATVAKGADYDECVENIDIGGPAMIRAAAKNHAFVGVVTEPADYDAVADEIEKAGGLSLELKRTLAARAYARTAAYDAAISSWFARELGDEYPRTLAFAGTLRQSLRYGENPHQSAAFYVTGDRRPGVASARQIQGKELSYNNLNDTDAAYECVAELGAEKPAVAIIKHANPCGVAIGASLEEAYLKALKCDPVSAFGGVIALNSKLDRATAEKIVEIFTEVIIAPDADEEALALLAPKKNVRVLLAGGLPDPAAAGRYVKPVAGGFLVQSRDNGVITKADLKIVTKRQPSEAELRDMLFAFKVAKHVKSNAIVYAKDNATVGIGAGQMSRV